MPGTCVIGLQWGDEAKGKLVDLLTKRHDVVARFLGGANAGHTVVDGENTYKLHHIPSGILSEDVANVVTAGVVINPPILLQEIDGLKARGVPVKNLMLSDRAHIIFPWHMAEDRAMNQSTADGENIGTTMRGIGPCYRDKVGRAHAIRLGDLIRPGLKEKIALITAAKNKTIASMYDDGSFTPLDADAIYTEYAAYAERLREYVTDSTSYLLDAADEDKRILFEGAQGALLDVDHGTYPFVTSSNSSGVGAAAGSGVPAKFITQTIGVVKAYSTRVGGGPFPTEQDNELGEKIRIRGNEFGTTTGRPRRCGWFDAVAVRYTARISGIDTIALMMLDVLSTLDELKICVAYDLNGERLTNFPSHVDDIRKVKPIYETLPGWAEEITGARSLEDLPANALAYIQRISELVGCEVGVVSVGPDRKQTIFTEQLAMLVGAAT
ncbi:adenylosuccinate synthase [Blastopirellula sp. JC732]|uniref:Adenylosuccinate synthetase n=1 Tax=Blastopirellula sediminis TaxID=2894196 RepID=A0A9X1SES0_9BACT|nr:adenylosuccinate synthase [Blastopirellula sediminis]MCC9604326.1 adenylosuccinate synthase [Blastopirellula sediminis]MCC9626846.1 adenylosuccinate synthase [Blastopirellula sediminis]